MELIFLKLLTTATSDRTPMRSFAVQLSIGSSDPFSAYRWPEMVTFEELNMKPPNDSSILRILVSALQVQGTESLLDIKVLSTGLNG